MIKLNKQTVESIDEFCDKKFFGVFQGAKLEALYKLIQKKGVKVTEVCHESNNRLLGLKALEYKEGKHVMLIHTPASKNFFPCKMEIISFTNSDTRLTTETK